MASLNYCHGCGLEFFDEQLEVLDLVNDDLSLTEFNACPKCLEFFNEDDSLEDFNNPPLVISNEEYQSLETVNGQDLTSAWWER